MSSSKVLGVLSLASLMACSAVPAVSAEVCPARPGHPLRSLDVFDGTPQEQAMLVPDEGTETSGHWSLGYVYEAGRIVTIRCKYAGGQTQDVPLTQKVDRCDFKIKAKNVLALNCK